MSVEDRFVPVVVLAPDYVSGGVFPEICKKSYDELMTTEKRVWDAAASGDLVLVSAWFEAGQNLNESKKCVCVSLLSSLLVIFGMLTQLTIPAGD